MKFPRHLYQVPFIFVLLYVLWVLHSITLIILPISFFFIIYLAILYREIKYYILLIISFVSALIIAYVLRSELSSGIVSFFNAENMEFNKIYIEYILNFPFITVLYKI